MLIASVAHEHGNNNIIYSASQALYIYSDNNVLSCATVCDEHGGNNN